VVDGYQAITPGEIQTAVSNVVSNLTEPLTIGSSLLQGDTENAAIATKRFIINSTAGMGGISDVAAEEGYQQRREDLGQALAAHGVAPGPHIVLPIIGPSNFRDAAGDIATFFINPLPIAATVATGTVEYSDQQDAVKAVSDNAIDAYVAERDGYQQNRQFVINNGQQVEIPVIAVID
jgi:phospholipid-binding lipoprotein MlaA